MKRARLFGIFLLAFLPWVVQAKPVPVSATIDGKLLDRSEKTLVGNVVVRFNDGHTERWTKLRRYYLPKVSAKGHVGWGRSFETGPQGYLFKASVRVRLPGGELRDFETNFEHCAIEDWNFSDRDTTIIIHSVNIYHTEFLQKYDLKTGELLDATTNRMPVKYRPVWAEEYFGDLWPDPPSADSK